MKIERRTFRIGELAQKLNVERFVIRFWEKEFDIESYRSDGKQRFYTEKDFERFSSIKSLLYDQGFTIAGAKKFLKTKRTVTESQPMMVASQITTLEPTTFPATATQTSQPSANAELLLEFRKRLVRLQELL